MFMARRAPTQFCSLSMNSAGNAPPQVFTGDRVTARSSLTWRVPRGTGGTLIFLRPTASVLLNPCGRPCQACLQPSQLQPTCNSLDRAPRVHASHRARCRAAGWWLTCVVRPDERDDLSWRRSGHGHGTTLERADRFGEPILPEVQPLLRRPEELGPLLLLLQNTAIDGRMVDADQGVCGALLDFLRACGRRTGRGRCWGERRSRCTPRAALRLLISSAKDWLSFRFGVDR